MVVAFGGITGCYKETAPAISTENPPHVVPPADTTQGIWKRNVHHHRVIVFVHGLFGDPENTWTYAPGITWPALLESDPAIYQDTAIYLARYQSPYFHGRSDIDQAAATLFSELAHDQILEFDEVYIVAHSLGGLVVQRMMLQHQEQVEHVRFVYEFGTPHEGSAVATIARVFDADPYLNQLSAKNRNGLLGQLNKEWAHYIKRKHPKKARSTVDGRA